MCRNRKFALLSGTEVRSDPSSCPVGHNLFSAQLQQEPGDFSISEFMSKAATWLLVSAVLSLSLGFVFLYVFKWHSKIMTRLTIQIEVLIPAIMGIAAICAGQVGGGAIMILMALLAAVVFWMWYVCRLLAHHAETYACSGNSSSGFFARIHHTHSMTTGISSAAGCPLFKVA